MTLEEFVLRLKALLKEARDSGLDTEDVGQLAEETIAGSWDE
jgi:hypothetical protein